MAHTEYPENWKSLFSDIVSELEASDISPELSLAYFQIIRSICDKIRTSEMIGSTSIKTFVIKAAEDLTEPLFQFMQSSWRKLSQWDPYRGNSLDIVVIEVRILTEICGTFHLINKLDTPTGVDDQLPEWNDFFHDILEIKDQHPFRHLYCLRDQGCPFEALQLQVLQCMQLNSSKVNDETADSVDLIKFRKQRLDLFFQRAFRDVENLFNFHKLKDNAVSLPANQSSLDIITRSLMFLSSVVAKKEYENIYSQHGNIVIMVGNFIFLCTSLEKNPSTAIRERSLDLDFFRDDVVSNHKHIRAATDLLQAIIRNTSANEFIADLVLKYVSYLATQHVHPTDNNNRGGSYLHEAVSLILGISFISSDSDEMNPIVINSNVLVSFYKQVCEPEIKNLSRQPLAKASAIRFIIAFKKMFPSEVCMEVITYLFQLLDPSLNISDFEYTWAAYAIDSLAYERNEKGIYKIPTEFLMNLTPAYLVRLLNRLVQQQQQEQGNEFLMQCLIHAMVRAERSLVSMDFYDVNNNNIASKIYPNLCTSLALFVDLAVRRDPEENRDFNYHLFDAVALLLRNLQQGQIPQLFIDSFITEFESRFNKTIMDSQFASHAANDEFSQYVYQLMACFLDVKKIYSSPLNQYEKSFFDFYVLDPAPWTKRANIPALTDLIVAYLHIDYTFSVERIQKLVDFWKMLINANHQEIFAFKILNALIDNKDFVMLTIQSEPVFPNFMKVLLSLVKARIKSTQFKSLFTHSLALFSFLHGADKLYAILENGKQEYWTPTVAIPKQMQPFGGFAQLPKPPPVATTPVFVDILEKVVCKSVPTERIARLETAAGITVILTKLFLDEQNIKLKKDLLTTVVEQFRLEKVSSLKDPVSPRRRRHSSVVLFEEDEDDGPGRGILPIEYSSVYKRLTHASALPIERVTIDEIKIQLMETFTKLFNSVHLSADVQNFFKNR
jgi:hypothetical protein